MNALPSAARTGGARPAGGARWALAAAPAAFLGVLLVWPLANILRRGLAAADAGEVLGSRWFWDIAAFTAWQALLSTLLALALGLPAAWALARVRLPGRAVATVALTVPFVLPTVVVAAGFRALFDATGWGLDRSLTAILAAHVFFNAPVVVRTVGSAWAALDDAPADAARTLGAGPSRVLRTVTLPRLAPAVVASATLVYLFCFTSFGVVLLLGGPTRRTLETEISRQALARTDLPTAATVAAVQLAAVVALTALVAVTQRRATATVTGAGSRLRTTTAARLGAVVALVPLAALVAAPIGTMVVRSVRSGGGWSLAHYRALADRPTILPVSALEALRTSAETAVVAATLATVLGLLAALAVHRPGRPPGALGGLLDVTATLPAGVSAVALGLGLLVTFDGPPLALRSSWWIVPLAHALLGLPFVVRAVLPALRGVDPRLPEAARLLGARPRRVVRDIELALVRRSIAVGSAFAVAVSIGEFGAATMVARTDDQVTAPLALGRLLSQPGAALQGQAAALATCLAAVTAAVVAVLDRSGAGSRR